MTAPSMSLNVSEYFALPKNERDLLTAWGTEALGTKWDDVFSIRLAEGYCEFYRYLRDGSRGLVAVRWDCCTHDAGVSVVWLRDRVRCPLPPTWPLGRGVS